MTTPTPPGLLNPDAFGSLEGFQKALLEDGARRGWQPYFRHDPAIEQSATPAVSIGEVARDYETELFHFTPTSAQRKGFARSGYAMPDGSFYIRPLPLGRGDLGRAIQAVGRATPNAGESETARRNAVRRHIMRRARALKLTSMIPDSWNPDGSLKQVVAQGNIPVFIAVSRVNDFLTHFGVKGMHWGVRRGDNAGGPKPPRHPVSSEAAKAQELQRQVKKQGTQSLSNADLQALVTRLNLERQYQNLNPQQVSAGHKFVNEVLRDSAKQLATQFIVKNAPKGASWVVKQLANQATTARGQIERQSAINADRILREAGAK